MSNVKLEDRSVALFNAGRSFRQPNVAVGSFVRFYNNSIESPGNAICAVVTKVQSSSITVLAFGPGGARNYPGVKHVSDPRLQMSEDQRASGSWDYSEDFFDRLSFESALLDEIDDLRSRLGVIEDAAKIPRKPSKLAVANKAKAIEFNNLRQQATQLGIEGVRYMNRAALVEAIRLAQEPEKQDASAPTPKGKTVEAGTQPAKIQDAKADDSGL